MATMPILAPRNFGLAPNLCIPLHASLKQNLPYNRFFGAIKAQPVSAVSAGVETHNGNRGTSQQGSFLRLPVSTLRVVTLTF